jgi:hypothetical protein
MHNSVGLKRYTRRLFLNAVAAVPAFDARSLLFGGRREFLLSGEIHYARSPRESWPALLDRSLALGLNCVATYVFWNYHETARDLYDFSGGRDLGHFLDLCAERGLRVLLRMGPYICAEWNYGGFPPYLRDEPGIVIRTWSQPYMRRVEKYFEHLAAEVRPRLASRGGPVNLVQVENEYTNVAARYGAEGARYLAWVVDLAKRIGIDVPLTTCEGGAPGSLLTVNGHSIAPERCAKHLADHPGQPLLWTEVWPAWYDTWGFQRHLRDSRNLAFHLLRFVACGGAGWNYYMWHGGTHFGRNAMYLQTTSYGFDAPLDEYGRATPKAQHLARLHSLVRERGQLLLGGERSHQVEPDGTEVATWTSGGEALRIRLDPAQRTGRVLDGYGRVLFDTAGDYDAVARGFRTRSWESAAAPSGWQSWREPMPAARPRGVTAAEPLEQLGLTRDETDYCWYSARIRVVAAGPQTLEIPWGGDFFYVFLDGKPVVQSQPPFQENRGPTGPEDPAHPRIVANDLEKQQLTGFRHRFAIANAAAGEHRLDILAVALGLIKGDWQIADSMNTERKGIWGGVLLNGARVRDWEMRPHLVGEQRRVAEVAETVEWREVQAPGPCTWYQARFALAESLLRADADFRLDAAGLGKGYLFVNGRALGRYWLLAANGYGADRGWHRLEEDGLSLAPAGEPTQRWYHVPRSWLRADNRLTIFEEQDRSPTGLRLEVRR